MDLLKTLRILRALWVHERRVVRHLDLADEWRRKGVSISDRAIVTLGSHGILEIGEGSSIGPYTLLDLADDPNALPGRAPPSTLVIGRRTAINEFNNIRAAGGEIHIGDNCLISQFVSIVASNHSYDGVRTIRDAPWRRTRHPVEIGDDVWIGANAVILPGVHIGTGCVIAAGSVVAHDIPPYSVVGGAPATVKRMRIQAVDMALSPSGR